MNGSKLTVELERKVAIEDKCSKTKFLKKLFLTLLESKDNMEF